MRIQTTNFEEENWRFIIVCEYCMRKSVRVSHTIGTFFSINNHNKETKRRRQKNKSVWLYLIDCHQTKIILKQHSGIEGGNQTRKKKNFFTFLLKKINSTKKFLKTKIRNRFKGIAISVFVVSLNIQKKIFEIQILTIFWCFGEDIENLNFFFHFLARIQ